MHTCSHRSSQKFGSISSCGFYSINRLLKNVSTLYINTEDVQPTRHVVKNKIKQSNVLYFTIVDPEVSQFFFK